jgi:hypothetical protein
MDSIAQSLRNIVGEEVEVEEGKADREVNRQDNSRGLYFKPFIK